MNEKLRRYGATLSTVTALGGAVLTSAEAKPEAIQRAEQTPQAVINRVDKKMLSVEKKILAAKGVGVFDNSKKEYGGDPKGIYTYFVSTRSTKYPNRYDNLAVIVRRGEKIPLLIAATRGATSDTFGNPTKQSTAEESSFIDHTPDINFDFLPYHLILASEANNKISYYCAASKKHIPNSPVSFPQFGESDIPVNDLSNPWKAVSSSVVSKKFNDFIAEANSILEQAGS